MDTPKIKASQINQMESLFKIMSSITLLNEVRLKGFPDEDKNLFRDVRNSLEILRDSMKIHIKKNLLIEDDT